MNILVVGGGGREHAIVMKLAESNRVEKLYCAPGNGGISKFAECFPVKATDIVKSMGVDNTFLLAVGGGSVADATKFIAAASKYTETPDPWNMVLSGGKGIQSAVPLGCVMTLYRLTCCFICRRDLKAIMVLFCLVGS